VDSNLVAALIIAVGRALRRLLRPARAGAKLMVDAAGDLTRTRSELMTENRCLTGAKISRQRQYSMAARLAQRDPGQRHGVGDIHAEPVALGQLGRDCSRHHYVAHEVGQQVQVPQLMQIL